MWCEVGDLSFYNSLSESILVLLNVFYRKNHYKLFKSAEGVERRHNIREWAWILTIMLLQFLESQALCCEQNKNKQNSSLKPWLIKKKLLDTEIIISHFFTAVYLLLFIYPRNKKELRKR